MRAGLVGLLVCAAFFPVSGTAADAPVVEDGGGDFPVFSRSKRIAVRGLRGGVNVEMAAWAEEVIGKVEDAVGYAIPLKPTQPIVLAFHQSEDADRFQVQRQQRLFETGLMQKLAVLNFQPKHQEDVLEGLVGLMLNRYAISKQSPEERRSRLATVPDWASVGCAQHLYAKVRERNRALMSARWAEGKASSLEKLLELERIPPGRWPEKSACGMLFGWLSSLEDWRRMVPPLFARWGRGDRISKEWLATYVDAIALPVDAEKHWDLWLARLDRITTAPGVNRSDQLGRLEGLMVVEPLKMGLPYPREDKPTLNWEELPGLRGEPWFETLRMKLLYQVQFLSRGQSVAFKEVIDAYAAYLEELDPKRGGLFRGAPSRKRLLEQLAVAHALRADYEAGLRQKLHYLDRFERSPAEKSARGQ